MPTLEPRGVRKVNEVITQNGRSLVITENDDSKLSWELIQDGTLKVDKITGTIYIKLTGETDWVPAGIRGDGTLCIDKDTNRFIEVFTILTTDNGDRTFTYKNAKGEKRTKRLSDDGYPLFELEEGCYILKRNNLSVVVDNKILNEKNTGIIESDEIRFALKEAHPAGTVVMAEYFCSLKIGNPYPRFFQNVNEPAVKEYGDFWIDPDDYYLNAGDGPTIKWWDGSKWITICKNTFIWLNAKLDREIADRIADVDAEEAARIAADTAEAGARASTDGSLQSQIDALKGAIDSIPKPTGESGGPTIPPSTTPTTTTGSGDISILSGIAQHGELLPVPNGYTESQCTFFVSPMNIGFNTYSSGGDNDWNKWDDDDYEECRLEGRKVLHYHLCHGGTLQNPVTCSHGRYGLVTSGMYVNYLVIGVK